MSQKEGSKSSSRLFPQIFHVGVQDPKRGNQVFHSHGFTAKKYRLLFIAIFITHCSSKLEVRETSRTLAKPK